MSFFQGYVQCALRETFEETGLDLSQRKLDLFHDCIVNKRQIRLYLVPFVAERNACIEFDQEMSREIAEMRWLVKSALLFRAKREIQKLIYSVGTFQRIPLKDCHVQFTPWFVKVFKSFDYDLICSVF
jgi:8-oxo-dGTP pyrophosphatase MutT (NUDIX family)